jgi:hypothetical protein
MDNPRLKTLRSIASTAFYNLFKKKMNIQRLAKEQLFFLLSSLLLSIERIKNKNETDVLLKR